MDAANSELAPMERDCEDCGAPPGEQCHFNCSSRWTTPSPEDDDATANVAPVPGEADVPSRR